MSNPYDDIETERFNQNAKWGEQNHPDGTALATSNTRMILARDRCNSAAKRGLTTWAMILEEEVCEAIAEKDPVKLREELVQVAAVAVAWLEAIDRRSA